MAVKIPGVVYNGIPAQLQPGDTIDLSSPGAIGSIAPANGTFLAVNAQTLTSSFGVYDILGLFSLGLFGFNASGTNTTALSLSIFTGLSTGNATPPDILFGNSAIGSSGSALQAQATRMRLTGIGNLVINGTDNGTDRLQVTGTGIFSGQLKANASTGSTSPTTGALVVPNGGAGVNGRVSSLNATFSGNNASTSVSTGTVLITGANGGLGATGQITGTRLYATTTLRINGSTFSVSSTAPTGQVTGDQWLEVNGSNLPLYGWWWHWNGTYWLSPEMRAEASFRDATLTAIEYFNCNPLFNYFFRSLNLSQFTPTTQTGVNNWATAINRIGGGSTTDIATSNSNGNGSTDFVPRTAAANVHVNVSSTGTKIFSIQCTPAGSPGLLYAGIEAVYSLARI